MDQGTLDLQLRNGIQQRMVKIQRPKVQDYDQTIMGSDD